MSPAHIINRPDYQRWVRSFSPTTSHILCGEGLHAGQSSFLASTLYNHKLHAVCPTLFPRVALQDPSIALTAPSTDLSSGNSSMHPALPMMTYALLPFSQRGLSRPLKLDLSSELDLFRDGLRELKPPLVLPVSGHDTGDSSTILDDLSSDCRFLFLGTGCAVPSKYRNVSCILLKVAYPSPGGKCCFLLHILCSTLIKVSCCR